MQVGVAGTGLAKTRAEEDDGEGEGEDELLCYTDAQNRLFGTRPALLWCNTRRVQELLQVGKN